MVKELKSELKKYREFEIAEALLSQPPKRLESILRILKNKEYSEKRAVR